MAKFWTLDSEDVIPELIMGAFTVVVLAVLYLLGVAALNTYRAIGIKLLLLYVGSPPVAIFLIWVLGHCLCGLADKRRGLCPGCKYRCGNIFTEWFHKRRCLPFLTKHSF